MKTTHLKKKSFFYLTTFTMLITTLVAFNGCGLVYNKDSYVKSFTAFVEKVKVENKKYTEEDWKQADLNYDKFAVQDYNKYLDNLTETDKEKIGKIEAQYKLIKFKKESKNIFEDAKNALYQVKGAIKEVVDSI